MGNKAPHELLSNTAEWGVLKKLKPATLKDFKGGYNLLRSIQEAQMDRQPDPSLAQLRNRIVEHIGIPLASNIHNPTVNKTFLFYGP